MNNINVNVKKSERINNRERCDLWCECAILQGLLVEASLVALASQNGVFVSQ